MNTPVQSPPPIAHTAPVAKRPRWKLHMTILVVVNIMFLVGIFVLSQQMEKAGLELKKLRTEKLAAESHASDGVAQKELEEAIKEFELIKQSFPNEDKLLEFVTSLDDLKKQGFINEFKFASDIPLKDKSGIYGLPILIVIKGSSEQIGESLKAINALPVMVNSVKIEVVTAEDGSKTMKFGGFLYVDQEFSKN